MAKQFCVNFTRTITVECNVVVSARNDTEAMEKVQRMADDGKLGDPSLKFPLYGGKKGPSFDIDLTEETIEVTEANLEDE